MRAAVLGGSPDGLSNGDVPASARKVRQSSLATDPRTMPANAPPRHRKSREHAGEVAAARETVGTPPPEPARPEERGSFSGPFGDLLVAAHEAILLVDEQQRVIGFNPAAEALFGCSAGEALGSPLERFVPAWAREKHTEHVRRFSTSEEEQMRHVARRRVAAVRADGREIGVEVTLSRVEAMAGGEVRQWSAALVRDLSTEDALRGEVDLMTRRLYAALDATPVAVWITEDERILYANRIAARMAAAGDGEALRGRMLDALLTQTTLVALRAATANGTRAGADPTVRVPGQLRRADAAVRDIEIVLAPLPDHGHTVVQMVIEDVTEQRRHAAEQERSGRALRRLQANVVEAREEERRRIARELHDELGQRLTALKMEVSSLAKRVGLRAVDAPVSSMLAMLDETVAAVRRIASDLRPLMLDDLGLNAAIEWLARDTARRTGIEIAVQLPELSAPPDERLATALYRMVQEGLTNIVRHAHAGHAQVQLRQDGDAIDLTVTDDGHGLPEPNTVRDDAYGLLGLRERVAMLGGTLTLDNRPGGGARLAVRVPLARRPGAGS